jgi:hypothetical protein
VSNSVTYPRFVWIAFSLLILVSLQGATFPAVPLSVWSSCGGCATNMGAWNLNCWILMGGGVWVVIRTYAGAAHFLAWWYRRGHWLPPSRSALDAYSTPREAADAVWSHSDYGVLRPWINLDLYSRIERIETWLYMAFAAWVWLQLSACHHCPRWTGDAAGTCGRHAHLALAPVVVLTSFAVVRAYFGPLPERPTRRE